MHPLRFASAKLLSLSLASSRSQSRQKQLMAASVRFLLVYIEFFAWKQRLPIQEEIGTIAATFRIGA